MRKLLFSSRLSPGYERYALLRSVLAAILFVLVGVFAAYFMDISPNPNIPAAIAIILASLLWFGGIKKYRLLAAIWIGVGGLLCFIAFRHADSPLLLVGLLGFLAVLRYFSEGPVRQI